MRPNPKYATAEYELAYIFYGKPPKSIDHPMRFSQKDAPKLMRIMKSGNWAGLQKFSIPPFINNKP